MRTASWGSGKVFVVRDNRFVDVSSCSLEAAGLPPAKQQAFSDLIDAILHGKADQQKTAEDSRSGLVGENVATAATSTTSDNKQE
jgi:hypothetical protein